MTQYPSIKPFLKWAGGKDKLFNQLEIFLPPEIKKGEITNYYEPFLGSGAVFFNLIKQQTFEKVVLSDINEELILVYTVIQNDVEELIQILDQLKSRYLQLSDSDKEKFYYDLRTAYNYMRFNINYKKYSNAWIPRAAQMIFLNKTCYNGLYRQNLRGDFNVPFGKNFSPPLYEYDNMLLISSILKKTNILISDFEDILDQVPQDSFVYLDPPYRPISKTARFNDYYKLGFNEKDNDRLMHLLKILNQNGVKFMLNNSFKVNDEYVQKYYSQYNIAFIKANRMMSSIPNKRNKVSEIVITNY